jgi:hypothetical protein
MRPLRTRRAVGFASICGRRLKTEYFSSLFYALNICGFAYGVYLVLAHSVYRILVVYCLFNVILFWVTGKSTVGGYEFWFRTPRNLNRIMAGLAISVMVLPPILAFSSYGRLYARSSFLPPVIAAILALLVILALANVYSNCNSFFTSPSFILPILVSITLFVNFSIYLVQPKFFSTPLYGAVDAYRDYVDAARIVRLSSFRPQDMVLQQYYTAFPVVPILCSFITVVGGLSIQVAPIIIAVTFEILAVVVAWLLSTAVARKFAPSLADCVGALSVIFVWLQPYFMEPGVFMTPIRFSIPLVTLVMYLIYQIVIGFRRLERSVLVSILILAIAIIPMHPTTALFLVTLSLASSLVTRTLRSLGISVAVTAFVYLNWYLVTAGGLAFTSLLVFMKASLELMMHMTSFPMYISAAEIPLSEPMQWMENLPMALVLSLCTICVAKAWRLVRDERRGLSSLHFVCGLVALVGLSAGYLSNSLNFLGRLDMRYLAWPMTGLVLIACALVVGYTMRNAASKIRVLILIGITLVYVTSIAYSPNLLYEINPARARLISTESESAAASFVANILPAAGRAQVVSDWPFYNYILGLMLSNRVGIEHNVTIVNSLFDFPSNGLETVVVLRQYYLQNFYLRALSPQVRVLNDVTWNSPNYDRIFDSSTACAYLGMFEG